MPNDGRLITYLINQCYQERVVWSQSIDNSQKRGARLLGEEIVTLIDMVGLVIMISLIYMAREAIYVVSR